MEVKDQVRIEAIKVQLSIGVFKYCEWLIECTLLTVEDILR